MSDARNKRAKLNIVVSLLKQVVTMVCGLIVPRLMLVAFGSEVNGAMSSIAQFLSYITLIEGGVGGIARAALYEPLAHQDYTRISKIISEIQRFFRTVGYIFAAYVVFLAVFFRDISHLTQLDWFTTCLLVIVTSLSSFGQYFIGISYAVLIQSSQKVYVTDGIATITTVLNTVLIVICVSLGFNVVAVKLVSSLVFIMRPIMMALYVKKHYNLHPIMGEKSNYLDQKWTGLGQHIAYFLHSNTDIAVLTIMHSLSAVSVYAVYNNVVAQIQNVTVSFSSGMEALFGNMLANKEYNRLHRTFNMYETMISIVSSVLFGTTLVMIVPFVRLYTVGISDADYIQPVFAILLIIAAIIFCCTLPYQAVVLAKGHYRQTKMGAYGEAVINITLSVLLVPILGLAGVAVGTIVATLYRLMYYVVYLAHNIIERSIIAFIKRQTVNVLTFVLITFAGTGLVGLIPVNNFVWWLITAVIVFFISVIITGVVNRLLFPEDTKSVIDSMLKRRKY